MVTDVNEHLELLDLFVLLRHLSFEFVDLLLLLVFNLLEVLLGFGQFPPKIGSDPVLRGLIRFGIYGWFVISYSRGNLGGVAIDGGASIIDVSRQEMTIRVLGLQYL